MTDETMTLRSMVEQTPDADLLRDMLLEPVAQRSFDAVPQSNQGAIVDQDCLSQPQVAFPNPFRVRTG